MKLPLLTLISTLLHLATAIPAPQSFQVQNGLTAQRLDAAKSTSKPGDACTTDTCCGLTVCLCSAGRLVAGAQCDPA
ncbi:hypothetical protein HDU67_003223, partial [Dinochytrium kinnereticum]